MVRPCFKWALLCMVALALQACVEPYRRDPVDQIVEFPSDMWQRVARTHAP